VSPYMVRPADSDQDPAFVYFGPPTADRYCAYIYIKGGVTRLDLHCPNQIDFIVKVPDGRSNWRKGIAACAEHLPQVIWQIQEAYGGGGFYRGPLLLLARVVQDQNR